MTTILSDDRAQSIGIARLFLSLTVGAFVIGIVWQITTPLLDHARDSGSDEVATQGTMWMQAGIDHLPIIFLFIAVFGLVALSVFQREVLR